MKTTAWALLLALIGAVFGSSAALSGVGDIDVSNTAVARITTGTTQGTGVILSRRLVVTAGHVIYSHDGGYAKTIAVHFTDINGEPRTVYGRLAVASGKYIEMAEYADIYEKNPTLWKMLLPKEARDDFELAIAAEDVAYIITDESMFVSQQMYTILDDDLPFKEVLRTRGLGPWQQSFVGPTMAHLMAVIPLEEKLAFLSVGFGHHACADYEKWKGCHSDGKRRASLVDGKHLWASIGNGSVYLLAETAAGGLLWKSKLSPILPGDSGGALLAVHPNPRKNGWMLVGIQTRGNPGRTRHASLLHHADFHRHVLNSPEYRRAMAERNR